MTRKESRGNMAAMISNLGWPILLGAALCSVFLALLYQGPLNTPLMMRYFAGHPINLCTTTLFFIGLAALLFKFGEVATQYSALGSVDLPPAPAAGQTVEQVGGLLDYLASLSKSVRGSYLGRRLNDLLESVERKGSAAGLDDEIKYLADMDAARQQDSYALVKIVIWAAPMLGFLGTVVGITDALGDLGKQFANNKEAANDIGQSMTIKADVSFCKAQGLCRLCWRGKRAFNVRVEKDNKEMLLQPVMYYSEYSKGLMKNPDIANFATKDFYLGHEI